MNKKTGFSLVELVVVIAVMGMLAAVALPRFINVQSSARVAIGHKLAASLRSAANLGRASWVAAGSITTGTPTVNFDGQNVTISTTGSTPGYPTATAGGIGNALQNLDAHQYVADYTTTAGVAIFTVDGREKCTVTYTAETGVVNLDQLTVGNCG